MKSLSRAGLRGATAALAGLVAAGALAAPVASADTAPTAPPQFTDGYGLTVVSQPAWVDANDRTFTFTVTTAQVPTTQPMTGQVAGQHVIMVTLPVGYDNNAATRYPVLYGLHGAGDAPNTLRNQVMTEQSTAGVPLITVWPDGGGRSWYTNWANPGTLGQQNWETFHLDQVIPFVDANLRTIPTRAGRAIVGHSMGGFGAFHYAEDRPDLFSYVGSFSGGLDLQDAAQRAAVVATTQLSGDGSPTVPVDAIFGLPVWPFDGIWNAQSPAQHVSALRGMGIAMFTGNGGNLLVDPVQAVVEKGAEQTALTTATNLNAAGIPYDLVDYGDGSQWAAGCTGKHNQDACLAADLAHFIPLVMQTLQHP